MWLDPRWRGEAGVLNVLTHNRFPVNASYPGWTFRSIGRRETRIFSRFRG